VRKDGRFVMPVQVKQDAIMPITVLVNWTALKK
jgi:hypothetical protein